MKRLLLITSFILFTAIAQGQTRSVSALDAADPILRFYPNPATTVVNIDFQKLDARGYSIQIYNFLGKKMFESKNMTQKTSINLNEFNRGMYIYQLRDRTGRMVEAGKFQVSR